MEQKINGAFEKQRVNQDVYRKCERVFTRIRDKSKQLDALRYAGPRGVNDTYPGHGQRVADQVGLLGLQDPTTIAVAYLHDLGDPAVKGTTSQHVRTIFGQDSESILAGLEVFTDIDAKNMRTTERIVHQLEQKYPFGYEFSPREFNLLMQEIRQKHTNVIGGKDPSKYASVYDRIDQASQQITSKQVMAAHIAYLAASMDNLLHPKPGRTTRDLQKIALALNQHQPILLSMKEGFGKAADSVILPTFFPESYANLEGVLELSRNSPDGIGYQVQQYQAFTDKIKHKIIGLYSEVQFVTEEEMTKRRTELRNFTPDELERKNTPLLASNEVYIPDITVKSASSIFQKAMKHWVESNESYSRTLKPDLLQAGFGTPEFWKLYLKDSYDTIRTRVIFGDEAWYVSAPIVEELKAMPIVQNGENGSGTPNHATTLFDTNNLRGEFVERLQYDPDPRMGFDHIVVALSQDSLNCEYHVGTGKGLHAWYGGNHPDGHLAYKLGKEIGNRLLDVHGETRNKKVVASELVRMANRVRTNFHTNYPSAN